MRSLSDTLERLARFRKDKSGHAATARSRLSRLQRFGSNPGALQAWYHVPVGLKESPALVVVLHGCTQNAAGYDHASGGRKSLKISGSRSFIRSRFPPTTQMCASTGSPKRY